MAKTIIIRDALKADHDFMLSLSPSLAEVAKLSWHAQQTVQQMQNSYMLEMLNSAPTPNVTLIAELNGISIGFIHVCSHTDDISNEKCASVTLLAVSPNVRKMGVGQQLMQSAEVWAKKQGYRLLHLEVFANNSNAQQFYQNLGFEPEMLSMIKPLS